MASDDRHVGPDPLSADERREVYGLPAPSDWRKYVKPTLGVIVAVVVVLFVTSNWEDVTVSFVVFSVRMKLFWALVFSVVLGVLLGEAGRWWWRRRGRLRERRDGRVETREDRR